MNAPQSSSNEDAWRKVGAELRRLRTERGLSLAELARQVHYSKGYLSKLETGVKRITLEVARCCDAALNTGDALTALLPDRWNPAEEGLEPATELDQDTTEVCPYPGLAAFGAKQARWFFGRTQVTADLVDQLDKRLTGGGPLVVVAPSGAGKSSLLAAGLVPALARGALPGSQSWPVVVITPGAHPLTALRASVAELTGIDPLAESAGDPAAFIAVLTNAATGGKPEETPSSARIVLVVDQFEETFTECPVEAERQAFITTLCAAAQSAAALIVLGVRADFYGHCLAYPPLLKAVNDGHLALGPLSPVQLREIITSPAAAEGLDLEPGLVEVLLADLGAVEQSPDTPSYEPGALPLLAHALRATWQQRTGRLLSVAGYRCTGGIRQAIATTAERAYARLGPAEQQLAQQILLRLVNVGAQGGDTRRRVPRARLLQALPAPAVAVERVLESFGRARLITFTAASVEITHEALLRAWPRLGEWISADRAGLRTHQQLAEAADAWEETGRDASGLLRGSRLAIVRDWATGPGRRAGLSTLEETYLDHSIDQERREHQAEHQRTRRLRQLVGALGVLLILAMIAGGAALVEGRTVFDQRQIAVARELVANSNALTAKDPRDSMFLAIEALGYRPSAETRSALLSAQGQYFAGQLTGHNNAVLAVAFSPDGRTLATAGLDQTTKLWDVSTRRLLATLIGNGGRVEGVAFSPDGRTLATGNFDHTAKLWDVGSHQLIATLTGHTAEVTAVAFSRDGRTLATGGDDQTARLWDVPSHQLIATLPGHTDTVTSVMFSPDGRILATGGDQTARLWDVASHRLITTLPGHAGDVYGVAFSPDGRTLATASADKTAKLWDVASHRQLATLVGHADGVLGVAFSPDGRTLATTSADQTAKLWDVATDQVIATLTGHTNNVYGVAFSPDGRTLATGSADHTAKLWDVGGPVLISRPPSFVYGVAFSPDGHILATTSTDNTARLWDVASHQLLATLTGHTGFVWGVAFSPDGRTLAAGSFDDTTKLWDVASHQLLATLIGHADIVTSVVFSPDGRTLATASADHTVKLWDVASHQVIATLIGHSAQLTGVAFSPDGRTLATASADHTAKLWDVASHQLLVTLTGHTGSVAGVAFSPDGHTLATAGLRDDTAKLWDVATHQVIATLTGHTAGVFGVAFSPDGHTLATISADNTARLWDVANQALLATLTGHTSAVTAIAFSPDGHTLATGSADHSARLWNLDTAQVTDRLCRIIGTVDQADWSRLIPDVPYRSSCP